jgi:hypothetical protein
VWTLLLVSTGVAGTWLAAKHWWGWLIGAFNEVLWFIYALHTHDHALALMAWVWGAVNVRNLIITRRARRVARKADLSSMRAQLRRDAQAR